MRELCPAPETVAAFLEGRLGADEIDPFVDHLNACDDCRRETGLAHLAPTGAAMPAALRTQVLAAVFAAIERGSTCRVTPACPDVSVIAAHVEGRLEETESARLLDHAAACDECRRELAIVALRRDAAPVPAPVHIQMRVKHALSGGDSQRASRRIFRPARRSYTPWIAAAATLLAAGLAVAVISRSKTAEPQPVVKIDKPAPRKAPEPEKPAPKVDEPVAPRIEWPPVIPDSYIDEPRGGIITKNQPETEPKKPDPQPEPKQPEPRKPDPVTDKEKGTGKTQALAFAPVRLTDVSGEVFIERNNKKEKVTGIITVSDGDKLIADKLAAFFLLGDFPIALQPKTEVTIAFEKGTNAPSLTLKKGEALIDSSAGTGSKWLISNGPVGVIVDKTRSKFAAAVEDNAIALTALQGGLRGQDLAGDRSFVLATGERLRATPAEMAIKPDVAVAKKKLAAMTDARPLERTRFTLDRTAQPLAGILRKGAKAEANFLLSAAEAGDAAQQQIRVACEVGYQPDHLIRLKIVTRLQTARVSIEVQTKSGVITLFSDVKLRREQLNKPITIDVPFEELVSSQGSFTITRERDKVVSVGISGSKKDMFGDAEHAVRLDDLLIVERNP